MENLKVIGDIPLPRFGHTITLISKTKVVLFGGATGNTGKYSITGDTYIFDCILKKWKKIEPIGSLPTQRAAHAATSVELNQLVVYGGATGGGGLVSDDLFLLDLRSGEENAQWIVVPVVGTTPGRRYGHSLIFCKPYLLVFGGNTGNEPVSDVWCLNVEKAPFFWTKLEYSGEIPLVRVYHSAALCSTGTANGMMVVFGGRTADQSALNDTWGLRRHRDGRWDWVKAPYKSNTELPTSRYQHSTLFTGTLMLVIGGRTNNVGETVPLEVYDTESSDWYKFPPIQRFRHSCWLLDNFLHIHGGFEQESPNIPTDSITKVDISKIFMNNPNLLKYVVMQGGQSSPSGSSLTLPNSIKGNELNSITNLQQGFNNPANFQANKNILNKPGDTLVGMNPEINNDNAVQNYKNLTDTNAQIQLNPKNAKPKIAQQPQNKNVRLSGQAVIAVAWGPDEDNSAKVIKKIPIEKLQEEAKKLAIGFQDPNIISQQHSVYYESIYSPFINTLLRPKEWQPPLDGKFSFKKDLMIRLIDEAIKIFDSQNSVLRLRPPIKIFGNIHGQYHDLLRFFDLWGSPSDNHNEGDIESFDYLFLGNYVDRGKYSLETIFLLLALKLKYPEQLHMLRGNHEDRKINRVYGFAEECAARFSEDINDPNSIYQRLNKLFEYLPLAATIEDKILCIHGGIGSNLKTLDDIENIYRPITVEQEPPTYIHQLLLDILWSDPVLNENDNANNGMLMTNNNTARETSLNGNMIRFGVDRLRKFLMENNLSNIIRSHECVMDGFDKFSNGQLITVFSCTNYCGKHQNAAAVLIIKKNCEIIPKVIYPLVVSSTSQSSLLSTNTQSNQSMYLEEEKKGTFKGLNYGLTMGAGVGSNIAQQNNLTNSPWLDNEDTLKKRPATPPRLTNSKNMKKQNYPWSLLYPYEFLQ